MKTYNRDKENLLKFNPIRVALHIVTHDKFMVASAGLSLLWMIYITNF